MARLLIDRYFELLLKYGKRFASDFNAFETVEKQWPNKRDLLLEKTLNEMKRAMWPHNLEPTSEPE